MSITFHYEAGQLETFTEYQLCSKWIKRPQLLSSSQLLSARPIAKHRLEAAPHPHPTRARNLLSLLREQAWAERGALCSAPVTCRRLRAHQPQAPGSTAGNAETRQRVPGEAPAPLARGLRPYLPCWAHTHCHGGAEDTHLFSPERGRLWGTDTE